MPQFIDQIGRVPYIEDDTRNWIESVGRKNGLVKPQAILRVATDTNFIHNQSAVLYKQDNIPYGNPKEAYTRCMMNVASPGMRVPGILNWQVTEALNTVVQTASFEALNALPVSEVQTTLTTALSGVFYGKSDPNPTVPLTVSGTWAQDSLGVTRRVTGVGGKAYTAGGALINNAPGNANIEQYFDNDGYRYREGNVKYRTFVNQIIGVTSAAGFPDPRIPNDVDNDVPNDTQAPTAASAQGSYFILVDNEVIRITGYCDSSGNITGPSNFFIIPPGGRAINGVLAQHNVGAPVKLLGFAPYAGDWCSMGYLNVDDYAPQTALLRPGTCLVSYEGYGDIVGPLTHDYNPSSNYTFTGYWFITGLEPSIAEDGVPRVKVNLKGSGFMFDKQKITPDLVRRVKNQFGQWRVGEKENATIWAAAGHTRDIPGDWVDYSSWDPTLPGSFPLKIQTELAQHKAYFDHMQETEFGSRCLICIQEGADWLKTHKGGGANTWNENRIRGKHIYKESIRVLHPIKTYIRLMATLAAASWDHPALGTDLAQKFTKIPHRLYDNIRNINTGLIYNGQIVLEKAGGDKNFDWFNPTYDDTEVISKRAKMVAPFESTYDNAPFWQPMQDLAEINGCTLWVTREGYPVFKPRLFSMRPSGTGFKDLTKQTNFPGQNNNWNLSYGSSISAYSPNTDAEAVFTQCWVRANTAIDGTTLQVITGGTGWRDGKRVIYSGLGGNREGLMLTSGVQQVDQFEIPNLILGLDWDTDTAAKGSTGWGARFVDKDGDTAIEVKPPFYTGGDTIDKNTKNRPETIKKIQRTINFFIVRQIVAPYQVGNEWIIGGVNADGKFNKKTEAGVNALREFVGLSRSGQWTQTVYKKLDAWLQTNKHFVKFDPLWYVKQDFGWLAYISAITGAPLVVNKKSNLTPDTGDDYVPDQKATQKAVAEWAKSFSKSVINMGNRRVDESLDQSTARSISTNLADPRFIPGDVIWCTIPGFLEMSNVRGNIKPPFKNGIYITQITRQMDLQSGSYTATYSGHRYRGDFGRDLLTDSINKGYDFI